MRLHMKKTCPPRLVSKLTASPTRLSSITDTVVRMGCRLAGGVVRLLRSRAPMSENCSVRGIGVALIVSVSTFTLAA